MSGAAAGERERAFGLGAHCRSSSSTRFSDGCATGETIGGSCDLVPLLSEPCRYDASAEADEGSRLEQKRHRFPNVEHSRMIRIEADALRTNLAITLFALLDARADATLTTEQSRTVRTAVSLGHQDKILGLPFCIRIPLNFGRHLRPRHEAPSDCRRNAHPRRRSCTEMAAA